MQGNGQPELMLPQYGITLIDDQEGNPVACLQISTQFTMHQTFLCNAFTYRKVAKELHDTIIKAGRDMEQKQASKIVIAKGVSSDGLRTPQGRQQQRSRR